VFTLIPDTPDSFPGVDNKIFRMIYFAFIPAYSAVGIAAGYGLEDRGVGVRVPVGARFFSPRRPD
jgi:hypothetical protein